MTYSITNLDAIALEGKSRRLDEEAERLRQFAENTDNPDDWDAWKEADGKAMGYQEAVADALYGIERD